MHELELILGLLVAVAALVTIARRIEVPYPILLVLGGLALGFVPGLPRVELDPEIVLLLFLPPILFAAAFFTSVRDFRANLRPIALLALGLVLATTTAVGVVAHAAIGLPWAVAFTLGAILSPPDAVAATAIVQRLGVPRRIVTILEGESLVNDASGLVAYRFGVAAVLTGTFSLWQAAGQFVVMAVGGVVIGLLVGSIVSWVSGHLEDPPVEITISLMAPFAAYLPAEILHVSGVLAAVTAGVYFGYRSPRLLSSDTRLQARAVWDVFLFLINGLVFILIGLQLPGVLDGIADRPLPTLLGHGLLISLTVILVRFAWVFPATYLPRRLSPRLRARDPSPPWRNVAIVAFTGLRGVVSLAAALALPLTVAGGAPFPERDLVLFLTFCVILATLVGQGLLLPPLIRRLGVTADDSAEREEAETRRRAIEAALLRLDELAREEWTHEGAIDYLRTSYAKRAHVLESRFGRPGHEHSPNGGHDHAHEDGRDHAAEHREMLDHYLRLQREVLAAERALVIELRDEGTISDETLHRIERDLDLEELRIGG